ncbi:MAG: hypothetical protein QM764_01945 [Chitinophagaceae bacterium]
MSDQATQHASSYRDPSGFIFIKDGVIYRQVNQSFKNEFDFFIESGCYKNFAEKKLLISHEVVRENLTDSPEYYLTLKPERIEFISYPYEWSFDMLKDAALLTLQLAKEAVDFGLILKDATPFNIQWHNDQLIFIDTLSFEKYDETKPWIAYRQFCECFLAPLLLMHYSQQPLHLLLSAYPEGIPLNVTKKLLPRKSRFSLYTYLHIHLHAKIAAANKPNNSVKASFTKQKLLNLISSLQALINKLTFPHQQSVWSEYYDEASTRSDYLVQKKSVIENWLKAIPEIKTAVDLGANDGGFSRLLAAKNIKVVAADADAWCINNLYKEIRSTGLHNIQPLLIDLANPSPAIGVNNNERDSFLFRCKADLVLALAVVHHLVIGKNISFDQTAKLFSGAGNYLFIEFVPKEDEKIKIMLSHKKDIYINYNEGNFLEAYQKFYAVIERKEMMNSGRVLFLLKKKSS